MVDISKEKESIGGVERVRVPEEVVTVEAKRDQENLEVTSWIEKIEKKYAQDADQPTDVVTDVTVPQVAPQPQQPPVTLPVTQKQVLVGKNAKADLGIAWLVTWAIRQLKLLARAGKKTKLKDKEETK